MFEAAKAQGQSLHLYKFPVCQGVGVTKWLMMFRHSTNSIEPENVFFFQIGAFSAASSLAGRNGKAPVTTPHLNTYWEEKWFLLVCEKGVFGKHYQAHKSSHLEEQKTPSWSFCFFTEELTVMEIPNGKNWVNAEHCPSLPTTDQEEKSAFFFPEFF